MARKVGITLDDVVSAAATIADREGLEHVSLAGVAERLGVRSPSLYAHVDGVEGLRRQLQVRAANLLNLAFAEASAGAFGEESIRRFASIYREFAHAHPGLLDALLPAPRPGEDDVVYRALAEPALALADTVVQAGVAADDAIDAVRSLRSAVHGFVVLEQGGGFGMPDDIDASFASMVDALVRGLLNPGAPRAGMPG